MIGLLLVLLDCLESEVLVPELQSLEFGNQITNLIYSCNFSLHVLPKVASLGGVCLEL